MIETLHTHVMYNVHAYLGVCKVVDLCRGREGSDIHVMVQQNCQGVGAPQGAGNVQGGVASLPNTTEHTCKTHSTTVSQ